MKCVIIIITLFLSSSLSGIVDYIPFQNNGAIIINKEWKLFEKADDTSKVLAENINYLFGVTVVDRKDEWFFVNSYILTNDIPPISLYGWVKREDLAFASDFRPVNRINKMIVVLSMTEGPDVKYNIYSNGRYRMETKAGLYNSDQRKLEGRVLQYKNVIRMENSGDMFYYDENKKLKGFGDVKVKYLK